MPDYTVLGKYDNQTHWSFYGRFKAKSLIKAFEFIKKKLEFRGLGKPAIKVESQMYYRNMQRKKYTVLTAEIVKDCFHIRIMRSK